MSGMALLFLLRHMLFVNFGLGNIHKQHWLYSYEILRREWQKTCASMNKHEIFEQFEFPAQIWGFKLIPIKNLWILNFFHILSQMAAQGEDLNLEVLVIINKLLVCNQYLIGIWLS